MQRFVFVGHLVLIALPVLMLSGCMTFESPDNKYVLTKEGWKEIPKTKPAKTGDAKTVSAKSAQSSPAAQERSPNNKDGAWGFISKQRGREPDPMNRFAFVYPKGVDVAYIRLKEEFEFKTADDYSGSSTRDTFLLDYMKSKSLLHLRYEEKAGVRYLMRDWTKHPYGREEPENTIQVVLMKESTDTVRIQVSYYAGHTIDVPGYEASLKSRIEQALK